MLLPDLDQYYTPPTVARQLVELCGSARATKCLDTACGDGSLLGAARDVLPKVQCVGMDLDRRAVERLRRREPEWIISRGDALSSASWNQAEAAKCALGSDLALLNPPFSMASSKGIRVALPGFVGRCSIAMAHVIAVLCRANPARCSAIVPESFMFSDLDAAGRAVLAKRYEFGAVRGLRNSTFKGTRANALMVRFKRRKGAAVVPAVSSMANSPRSVLLVRGGLPLFEAKSDRKGLPYLHSTELHDLARGVSPTKLRRVRPIARGVVSGNVILLPRVGVPTDGVAQAVALQDEVQLSDCVMALCFESRAVARRWERLLTHNWQELVSLYRGTGARYTTVQRLRGWLCRVEARV